MYTHTHDTHIRTHIQEIDPDPDEVKKLLDGSQGLWWTCMHLLANDSLFNIIERSNVYSPLLNFLRCLSRERSLAPLLLAPLSREEGGANCRDMVKVVKDQAELFCAMSRNAESSVEGDTVCR
jgi:hypothetical protein